MNENGNYLKKEEASRNGPRDRNYDLNVDEKTDFERDYEIEAKRK